MLIESGKKVVSLEYEAYTEMAILELNKLCTKVGVFFYCVVARIRMWWYY